MMKLLTASGKRVCLRCWKS